MDGVGKIIGHHLLHHKLIAPHIQGLRLGEKNLRLGLLCQKLGRLNDALDQIRQIKPLHAHLIISEFQLIQRQQFLYHLIHL